MGKLVEDDLIIGDWYYVFPTIDNNFNYRKVVYSNFYYSFYSEYLKKVDSKVHVFIHGDSKGIHIGSEYFENCVFLNKKDANMQRITLIKRQLRHLELKLNFVGQEMKNDRTKRSIKD